MTTTAIQTLNGKSLDRSASSRRTVLLGCNGVEFRFNV